MWNAKTEHQLTTIKTSNHEKKSKQNKRSKKWKQVKEKKNIKATNKERTSMNIITKKNWAAKKTRQRYTQFGTIGDWVTTQRQQRHMTIQLKESLFSQRQPQRRVQLSCAFMHLHLLHGCLQLHFINSLISLIAWTLVIHKGSHFTIGSLISFQPKFPGEGNFCKLCKHLLHTPLW